MPTPRPTPGPLLVLLAGLLSGCGASRTPRVAAPAPVPCADTLPIPEPDRAEPPGRRRLLDAAVVEEMASVFSIRRWTGPDRQALNLTRFDDVVSSAWWERRAGYRELPPERIARGPTGQGPDTSRALTVVAEKEAGRAPGFYVRDARGDRYLFKFDPPGFRHMSTGAEIVSSRLLWAAGYHTPENYLVVFDSARLEPEAAGRSREGAGGRRDVTREDVAAVLSETEPLPDGRYLAVASEVVPGEPKGPFRFEGRRPDDPNDHYPHQHRRELRGLRVLAAWINHREIREANTLDSYVEPGYLRHYLIDFGSSLGSGTTRPLTPRQQRTPEFDAGRVAARLLTLGFYRPPWETRRVSVIDPAIGWMPVEGFSPAGWAPTVPNEAFRKLTARDGYWAAKIVASFSDADLRAVAGEAGIPRDGARDALVEILAHRRDATVAHWYGRVSPVESARVRTDTAAPRVALTFRDLGLRDGPWSAAETSYRWKLVDEERGRRWRGTARARPGSPVQRLVLGPDGRGAGEGERAGRADPARAAARRPPPARPSSPPDSGPDAYIRLWIRRGDGGGAPPAELRLRRHPESGRYRVVGLLH